MKFLRRAACTICVFLMMNIVLFSNLLGRNFHTFAGKYSIILPLSTVVALLFLATEVIPCYEKGLSLRLQVLCGGYEIILSSLACLLLELTGYLLFWQAIGRSSDSQRLAFLNGIVAYLVLLLHYLNGFWRTAICSSQLGIGMRILMLFFWWVVPINLILFFQWCSIVRRELIFEKNKYLLDVARKESEICRTHYPVVMVHGIFFRDWHFLNYWGRIPQALKKNGATVYYGRQQSSLSIADSAAELKAEIEQILKETGAEKVNIVAHSKGGLDSRYAISCLHLDGQVASLTTINTPHRGCKFADALLKSLPGWLVRFVASRYNALYHKLGDTAPDFLGGVQSLTAASCAVFNENVPDSPLVYYQSSMSKMHSVTSAGFPLNLGYLLAKKYEGDNDGLVSVSSASWGHSLNLLTAGRKGISHGDMIDLTHKNIKGFSVSEFYVQLFADLKKKGF